MGAVVAQLGMISLERKVVPAAMIQRIAAAALMTAAITMFYLSSR
jgi:hypothetical protein